MIQCPRIIHDNLVFVRRSMMTMGTSMNLVRNGKIVRTVLLLRPASRRGGRRRSLEGGEKPISSSIRWSW